VSSLPVMASHTHAALSPHPRGVVQARGDGAGAVRAERGALHRCRMRERAGERLAGDGVPDLRGLVFARGDEVKPIAIAAAPQLRADRARLAVEREAIGPARVGRQEQDHMLVPRRVDGRSPTRGSRVFWSLGSMTIRLVVVRAALVALRIAPIGRNSFGPGHRDDRVQLHCLPRSPGVCNASPCFACRWSHLSTLLATRNDGRLQRWRCNGGSS
jgi:hypothetical protein